MKIKYNVIDNNNSIELIMIDGYDKKTKQELYIARLVVKAFHDIDNTFRTYRITFKRGDKETLQILDKYLEKKIRRIYTKQNKKIYITNVQKRNDGYVYFTTKTITTT